MIFSINQPEHNFNSFIIDNITFRFDKTTQLYKVMVSFRKDSNNPYTSDCSILTCGTEKEIRDYLINEMHYHKFMGDDFLLNLNQKCLSYYKEEVQRYGIGFEFNEYQKEAFKILCDRGFKIDYTFSNNRKYASNYYCHAEQNMRYRFTNGIISVEFQNTGEIYLYNINLDGEKAYNHPLYKGNRKYVIEYLKTGKFPIAIAPVFSYFLLNNEDVINGRIIASDPDNGSCYKVFRKNSLGSLRLVMEFDLQLIAYLGIDLEKLLSELLSANFKE